MKSNLSLPVGIIILFISMTIVLMVSTFAVRILEQRIEDRTHQINTLYDQPSPPPPETFGQKAEQP